MQRPLTTWLVIRPRSDADLRAFDRLLHNRPSSVHQSQCLLPLPSLTLSCPDRERGYLAGCGLNPDHVQPLIFQPPVPEGTTTAVPQLLYPENNALKCLLPKEKGTFVNPRRAHEFWNCSNVISPSPLRGLSRLKQFVRFSDSFFAPLLLKNGKQQRWLERDHHLQKSTWIAA
jgi:hypothetical protein